MTCVLVVILAMSGLVVFVVVGEYHEQAHIRQALDSAPQQSREQLASRVVQVFEVSSLATSTPLASTLPMNPELGSLGIEQDELPRISTKQTAAIEGLLALFHPGLRANYDYWENGGKRPTTADVPLADDLDIALRYNYRRQGDLGNLSALRTVPEGVQPGDTFVATWGTRSISPANRSRISRRKGA